MPSADEIVAMGKAMQANKVRQKRSVPKTGRKRVVITATTEKKSSTLDELKERLAKMPMQNMAASEPESENLETDKFLMRKKKKRAPFQSESLDPTV